MFTPYALCCRGTGVPFCGGVLVVPMLLCGLIEVELGLLMRPFILSKAARSPMRAYWLTTVRHKDPYQRSKHTISHFNTVHLYTYIIFGSKRTSDEQTSRFTVRVQMNNGKLNDIPLMMRSCITAFAPDTGKFSVLKICFSCALISVFALATTTCTLCGSRDPAVAISDPATFLSTPSKPSNLASDPLW